MVEIWQISVSRVNFFGHSMPDYRGHSSLCSVLCCDSMLCGGLTGQLQMQLLEDMAQGLTSLHARGIVHRDLKPQNVLITDSGRGKLSDMGMCKRLIPNQSTFITSGAGVS